MAISGLVGAKVICHRMLVDKPLYSFKSAQWIFEDAPRDKSKTESCGAVGKCGGRLSDGVYTVHFWNESTQSFASCFALDEDMHHAPDAEYSWPPGCDPNGMWHANNQYFELSKAAVKEIRVALERGDADGALGLLDEGLIMRGERVLA